MAACVRSSFFRLCFRSLPSISPMEPSEHISIGALTQLCPMTILGTTARGTTTDQEERCRMTLPLPQCSAASPWENLFLPRHLGHTRQEPFIVFDIHFLAFDYGCSRDLGQPSSSDVEMLQLLSTTHVSTILIFRADRASGVQQA